jgi:antibiotic biosynthesis monooxygenase (ABM) superfamily enzyme
MDTGSTMPIHVAITRRVRADCEAEFQQALREFFQASFVNEGVWGANMITPLPGSTTREYGILRTFANETERDAFYKSPAFVAWDLRARALTEGEPEYRPLHGLEAWFRSPNDSPPRWKMAIVTFAGVYVITFFLTLAIGPVIHMWPLPISNAVFNIIVVAGLTWVVMPFLTRLLHRWLHPTSPAKALPL